MKRNTNKFPNNNFCVHSDGVACLNFLREYHLKNFGSEMNVDQLIRNGEQEWNKLTKGDQLKYVRPDADWSTQQQNNGVFRK